MKIHFILVEPTLPENVGASARAIKTMGFRSLRLVNPCNHLDKKTKWLAHGSVDILKNAHLYSNLKQAVHDMDFIIGTTSKKRTVKHDYYSSDMLLDLIKSKSKSVSNVAIIFGREDKGLLNSELRYCDIISSIPMKRKFPSLNLAQAVMIYAYSTSPLALGELKPQSTSADQSEMRVLKQNVAKLMQIIEIQPDSNIYNRFMERLGALGNGDIHLLHSLCHKLSQQLGEPSKL